VEIASRQNTNAEDIGNRHVGALLLGRLIILHYLMINKKMPLSPFLWLMLQIKSSKILRGPTSDLLSDIYKMLHLCDAVELISKIEQLLASISGKF
jgi:hypothetical protein